MCSSRTFFSKEYLCLPFCVSPKWVWEMTMLVCCRHTWQAFRNHLGQNPYRSIKTNRNVKMKSLLVSPAQPFLSQTRSCVVEAVFSVFCKRINGRRKNLCHKHNLAPISNLASNHQKVWIVQMARISSTKRRHLGHLSCASSLFSGFC